MKNLIDDLSRFIKMLSLNDIIFFTAVVALIVLIVTVIYLLKLGKIEKEELIEKFESKESITDGELLGLESESKDGEDVLPPAEDEPETLIDLETLTKALEDQDYDAISTDKYQKEEEERAIISYEELLKNKRTVKINYKEETNEAGINVKKIDLDNLTTKTEISEDVPSKVRLVSYEKEEAFLKALKDLQSMLG